MRYPMRAMSDKRLELALERLSFADWPRFERFASEFLASEMPDLRTVAAPSGDGGRDAELFSPTGDPTQVLQYSVTEEWERKINETAARITETIPTAQILVYVTNQVIGAKGDEIKKKLRQTNHLHLDIRDRSYFLERHHRDMAAASAAENLARDIVDPYLAAQGVLERRTPVLETHEARAAHVYLSLQLRDESQQKGLTKLSFEALVRSVLTRTDSEHRLARDEIKLRVRQLLPHDAPERVDLLVDSALDRLTKRAIRHWVKPDEFCLMHEERERVSEYLAEQELSETALLEEIRAIVRGLAPASGDAPPDVGDATTRLRRVLERCLYERADSFASSVLAGDTTRFATDHLHRIVLDDLKVNAAAKGRADSNPVWIECLVREILAGPGEATRLYLRDLADAYTLLAFLRQTPDVQGAVNKMFSHGEIWLDTSAILPLLAEELIEDRRGQFQQMIELASRAGLAFFVTDGVVEELDRHINRALVCCRTPSSSWHGRLPFLFEAFLQAGRPPGEFAAWTECFRGPKRPVDDIFEFLRERFGIDRRNLEEIALKGDEDLRRAVQEIWHRIHSRRRERTGDFDPITVQQLSRHDTENYVGVITLRQQEKPSPFGYSAWWLTLDHSAFGIGEDVARDFGIAPPDSPVLSLDFLSQYLALGPIRPNVSKDALRNLPVLLEPRLVRFLTPELLVEASRIREEMKDLPERVTRRRVRDHLDEARRRMGPMAGKGIEAFFDELKS